MNETQEILQPTLFTGTMTSALSTGTARVTANQPLSIKAIFLISLYVVIFLLGAIGNISVVTFFAKKSSRSLYDMYIIHLAISDLLVSLISPPRAICSIVIQDDSVFLNTDSCRVLSAFEPVSVNASSWILTSMAIERYRGIVQPLKPRYQRRFIHVAVLMIWLISFTYFIPYISSIDVVGKHCRPNWSSPKQQLAFNAVLLFVQSVAPIAIMCFTLTSVLHVMSKRQKARLSRPLRGHKKNANLVVVLIAAIVVFIMCTLPYNIFYLVVIYDIGIMGRKKKIVHYIEWNDWLAIMVLISSVTNCCIYAGLHKDFKRCCMQCVKRRRVNSKGHQTTSCLLALLSERSRKSSSDPTTKRENNDSVLTK